MVKVGVDNNMVGGHNNMVGGHSCEILNRGEGEESQRSGGQTGDGQG